MWKFLVKIGHSTPKTGIFFEKFTITPTNFTYISKNLYQPPLNHENNTWTPLNWMSLWKTPPKITKI